MTRDEAIAFLRQQRTRGPLPASTAGLSAWLAALQAKIVRVPMPVPPTAVSPLRALGIVVEERDGIAFASFPADGDALDRVLSLVGLPPLQQGGADALLAALEDAELGADAPPAVSLPLRIQPAKACALGWSSDLFSLTVLINNVRVRTDDGALLPRTDRPVVAVCAEYDRLLTSLDPPSVADYALQGTRDRGVPMLRLPAGFLRTPVRVESTSRLARASSGRPEAVRRAGKFLGELDEAWQQRVGPPLEVAWPVYRPQRGGALLDAVVGRPLPEMELH
jgi:hypothetical protein